MRLFSLRKHHASCVLAVAVVRAAVGLCDAPIRRIRAAASGRQDHSLAPMWAEAWAEAWVEAAGTAATSGPLHSYRCATNI